MDTRQINVGLIGSKFMGRVHSNAYLKAVRFFDLPIEPVMHTVAARESVALNIFAKRWGWQHRTTDWEELIKNEQIGLLDIATPNYLHADQAIAALEAGRHVACEKPLAGTLDEARQMMQAAKNAKGAQTFVWYNYRRCPAVAMAQQLIAEGRLGRVYHVRAAYLQDWGGPQTPLSWRFQAKLAGSGAHGDLNAHMIDMARFLTGDEVEEVIGAVQETFIKQRDLIGDIPDLEHRALDEPAVQGKGSSTVDDATLFLARFKSGAVASFEASRLSTGDKNRNRIEVHGQNGAIRFDFERMNELQWYDATLEPKLQGWSTINVTRGHDGHPYAKAWWPDSHLLGYEHGFVNQVADMMLALGGERPVVPLADFSDAYETQRVLHAAIESARNRCPVPIQEIV